MRKRIPGHIFIERMSHTDSNIPKSIIDSALFGTPLRTAPSSLHFSDFLQNAHELVSTIQQQCG